MEILPLVPKDKIHIGCLTCSTVQQLAPMDMMICVGFGEAHVTKNGKLFYDGRFKSWDKIKRLSAI